MTERSSPISANFITAAAAAMATIGAATSLSSVVSGWSWLGFISAAALIVGATGLALRTIRTPAVLVGLAQVLMMLFLITAAFTTKGIAGVIPGPAAFSELNDTLVNAFAEIRTGLPPVQSSPAILCLVTIAIGLVAIMVDSLAVGAQAPAATGLVLLCVYAVPASLSDQMLPWWSFLLGALAFAVLLAVDGQQRKHRWRLGSLSETSPASAASSSAAATSFSGASLSRRAFSTVPMAVVASALVVGLVAGVAVTSVGTAGRLPSGGTAGPGGSGGFGVNAFTSLRGMLDQGEDAELFRVRGLNTEKRLLRAFTLDTFQSNKGWALADGPMPAGVPAGGALPLAPGDDGSGPPQQVQIEPVSWIDVWMPLYGSVRSVQNVTNGWFYDRDKAAIYSERRQRIPAYTESTWIAEPNKEALRTAKSGANEVAPIYTQLPQIDPRVAALARDVTQGQVNDFDKANALWRFFTQQNRFTYDTQTAAAADSDALADFLFNGRRGFCEQFASAMAVMLRSLGVPTRVAVGFTAGVPSGDHRSITSKDAHAWVEVYFPGNGWVSFDPTPRSDGRGFVPSYLQSDTGTTTGVGDNQNSANQPNSPATNAGSNANSPAAPQTAEANQEPRSTDSTWLPWLLLIAAVIAVLFTALSLFNAFWRQRRRKAAKTPETASAAEKNSPVRSESAPSTKTPLLIRTPVLFGITALWIAVLSLAAWLWSGWVAIILLVLAAGALTPAVLREIVRRQRLHIMHGETSESALAAWQEMLDDCADRGISITAQGTVRTIAQDLAARHELDESGQASLNTIVSVVERSWYSDSPPADPELGPAFEELREQLHRKAPLSWWARLFPRSLWRKSRFIAISQPREHV